MFIDSMNFQNSMIFHKLNCLINTSLNLVQTQTNFGSIQEVFQFGVGKRSPKDKNKAKEKMKPMSKGCLLIVVSFGG